MITINNKYELLEKIGNGSFGTIYKGVNKRTREYVAIKVEPIKNNTKMLKHETTIYQYLIDTSYIPNVKWYGKDEDNYYMVISLLGNSLKDLKDKVKTFSLRLTMKIGIQILFILKSIHEKGLVHRDIKPDNFLLGLNEDKDKIFMIDFGFCKPFIKNEKHIEMGNTSDLIGSYVYASINSHYLIESTRRDDLESLGYMLIYFVLGDIYLKYIKPDILNNTTMNTIMNNKMKNESFRLFKEKITTIEHVRSLQFSQEPNYTYLITIFEEELLHNYDKST